MEKLTKTRNIPHVVIVGAGFGGLNAARRLAKAPVRVTLLDRNNYHLFQPLLYQVATASVAPTDVAYPLRSIFRRQKNIDFRMAEVTHVNLGDRTLETSSGSISYDYLIMAVGGQNNTFGIESVANNSLPLKNLMDASSIRDNLLQQFEHAAQETDAALRQERLTFVVAGGGPTGVEMAGAIAELIRVMKIKDYPNHELGKTRVILLEALDRLLAALPEELGVATIKALKKKGVEVRLGSAVEEFDGQRITLRGGEVINSRTLIWAAGIRSEALVDALGIPQAAQRRARVSPSLQVEGHPEVYIIGDAAYLEDENGAALPMVAQVAIQQGVHAAENVENAIAGLPQQAFRYRDLGTMATIGRNQAVAWIGPLKLHGFLAWLAWLVVHIAQLIGFRNRLLVLINWAWDYFFYDRAVRLILPFELRQSIESGRKNRSMAEGEPRL